MAKLTAIESIGDVYAEKLQQAGITSVETFLALGANKSGRKEIADNTGISEKLILNWINRADLARIKGIGTQYADLLECSGVDTVPELAQRNPENLHMKMAEANTYKKHVRAIPAFSSVQSWIQQAKSLPRVIEY